MIYARYYQVLTNFSIPFTGAILEELLDMNYTNIHATQSLDISFPQRTVNGTHQQAFDNAAHKILINSDIIYWID